MILRRWSQIWINWGKRLTSPSKVIIIPEEQRRARLLSTLLLVGIVIDALIVGMRILTNDFAISTLIFGGISFLGITASYVFSRTRYYVWTAFFIVGLVSALGFAGCITNPGSTFVINYIGLGSLSAIIFLRTKQAVRIVTFNAVSVIALAFLLPEWNLKTVGNEVVFLISLSAIIYIVLLLLQRQSQELFEIERERHELELSNEGARLLSTFVRDALHEFKTPLSIISTSTYLLGKITDPDKKIAQLGEIEAAQRNINKLVDSLATMTKLDYSANLTFGTIELNRVIRDVVTMLQSESDRKEIKIVLQLGTENPTIRGDEYWLTQAIYSILDNAIRYSPEKNEVSASTSFRDNTVILEVQDVGRGISQEHLQLIFGRFYRIEDARTTRGMGLGLTIANRIIEVHRGRIEVESELGVGSTFRIMLPVEQAHQD